MIKLENLTKSFPSPRGAAITIDHINMEVPEGEICILLGASGCGKTTTLKMINRLIMPTSGKIYINGKDTDAYDVIELRRGIGYVIQQIGLFPNMTVEENICVVPDLLGWNRAKSRGHAAELLSMVELEPAQFLKRYPKELSGGQQQRVGVVRALAADPPVLLMDEPFGAIDPINREIIQDEFLKMQQTLRKTVMLVSHDIDEAVKLGDRIAIFRDGKIEQVDTPDNVLARPASPFVADFVGRDRTLKRLKRVKVGDALSRHLPSLEGAALAADALSAMRDHDLDMLVVVGGEGQPLGFVERHRIRDAEGSVDEHRRDLVATLQAHDDLHGAVALMFEHDVGALPCVDENGRFIGYVTRRGITRLLGEQPPAGAP